MFEKLSKFSELFDDELPTIPLEQQLETLAGMDIRLNEGVGVGALFQNFAREELEQTPYAMLLAAMGGVYNADAPSNGADEGADAEELEALRRERAESEEDFSSDGEAPETEEDAGEDGADSVSADGKINAEAPEEARYLPVSDDILYLDSDCIEEQGIYSEILRRMGVMARGTASFADAADTLDTEKYVASVSFTLGGKVCTFDLDVQDATIDTTFFAKVNAALAEHGVGKRFFLHLAEPEILVIFSDRKTVRRLNGETGVYFEQF